MGGSKSNRDKIIKPHLHGPVMRRPCAQNDRGVAADASRLSSDALVNRWARQSNRLRGFGF
ncbi:hypothetical protein H8A99_26885 [Bradyrhizobium sp. Arg68]|uniref:hypothetical protein n=1 Tax=Bradyrhizobium ivorense TaxID=2511166 RepID=UPI001E3B42B8|nr:hypothetical protein [Bradyrhizobium ivorense]MCC8939993.1 hypothetical protein [Bradyrhizobium ivorense]